MGGKLEDYLTLREAAVRSSVPYYRLWQWIKAGRLNGVRLGWGWFVSRRELDRAIHRPTKRQVAKAELYPVWRSVWQRAKQTGRSVYWSDFEDFAEWILVNLGARPEKHELDRIDNGRGYEPGNVQWLASSQHSAKTFSDTRSSRSVGRRTLDPQKAAEIRRLRLEGAKTVDLAQRFEVSRQTISRVLNGHAWVIA